MCFLGCSEWLLGFRLLAQINKALRTLEDPPGVIMALLFQS